MYVKTTRQIRVAVEAHFLKDQSVPDEHTYLWAYFVRIENFGDTTVQLLNRRWTITDGRGRTEEIRGPGVVGKQPVLGPNDAFEYASGCPLRTPTGFMVGEYEMATESGDHFLVGIPAFSLDSPYQGSLVN